MSFNDVASRFKKQADQKQQTTEAQPVDMPELYAIRARMLGVLIQDARHASGFTIEELAENLSVHPQTLQAWEFGQLAPSLPQVELLAYVLQVPISHFWGTETFEKRRDERMIDGQEYAAVRDRMIGVMVRSAREDKALSPDDLAARLGIHVNDLAAYESGDLAVPMSVLTSLSSVLSVSLNYFLEDNGRVGEFLEIREMSEMFAKMPEDVRDFIATPSNEAYIRVAMVLAGIPTENLRALAEGLIDITL